MAACRGRPAPRKIDRIRTAAGHSDVRFGARLRVRRTTTSCCLRRRFSAITARTLPESQNFAVTTAKVRKGEREIHHVRASVGETWAPSSIAESWIRGEIPNSRCTRWRGVIRAFNGA
jgi:hypothetical protein